MGIRGLTAYLERFPENFSPFNLHNTYVVIDGDNFLNYCHRCSGLSVHFGGEYLDFTTCVRIFLKQLQKCRVIPIFLFDGSHDPEGTKKETLLKRNTERIQSLSTFIATTRCRQDADNLTVGVPDILPKLTNQVFLDVLQQNNTLYLSCEHEGDKNTAELAIYLECPVMSNDSDFYLFQPPPSYATNYRIVPLKTLATECHRLPVQCTDCSASSSCYALSCSVFIPHRSILKQITPSLIPLLAVLIGNDVITVTNLPADIQQLVTRSYADGQIMSYNSRRIHAVVQWLSSFTHNDVDEAVKVILTTCNRNELTNRTELMVQCVMNYQLNPSETGQSISKLLGIKPNNTVLSSSSATAIHQSGAQSRYIDPSQTDMCKSVVCLTDALTMFPQTKPDSRNAPLCFHDSWPADLLELFRRGRMSTSLLDSLYVRGGAVLRNLFEDLKFPESVNAVSHQIRKLQSGLLMGLECSLGGNSKLCGLNDGKFVESYRVEMEMSSVLVDVVSVHIDQSMNNKQIFKTIFNDHLRLTLYDDHSISNDLQAIACILVYWFRNTQSMVNHSYFNPTYSSVTLAFGTLAVLTQSHLLPHIHDHPALALSTAELCEMYISIGNTCKEVCVRPNSCSLSIESIHCLNELQSIYLELQHCAKLLDVVILHHHDRNDLNSLSPSENWLKFWPSWMLFPSGRLFYWFTQALDLCVPAERLATVCSHWIPLFCKSSTVIQTSVHEIQNRVEYLFKYVRKMVTSA